MLGLGLSLGLGLGSGLGLRLGLGLGLLLSDARLTRSSILDAHLGRVRVMGLGLGL